MSLIPENTYLKAYEKLSQFKSNSKFSTWLIRIGINEALARLREQAKVFNMDKREDYHQINSILEIPDSNQLNPETKIINDEAKKLLDQAQKLKPKEKEPAKKIKAIDRLIADHDKKKAEYDKLIAEGNSQFDSKTYEKAKSTFQKASELLSKEDYPKNKIKEIDKLLEEQSKKEKEYKELMAKADKNFDSESYQEAINNYKKALKLKPQESKPQTQIDKATKALEKFKKLEADYKNALAEGDKQFADKKYNEAISNYEKAKGLKPKETKPQEGIDKAKAAIKAEEERLAKEKEEAEKLAKLKEEFDKLLAKGNAQLSDTKYEDAKATYLKASELIPTEEFPKNKIKEIDKILDECRAAVK